MSLDTIDILGQIADLKDMNYKNTAAVTVLLELLIEKGYFSRQEFTEKARELEAASLAEILRLHRDTSKKKNKCGTTANPHFAF